MNSTPKRCTQLYKPCTIWPWRLWTTVAYVLVKWCKCSQPKKWLLWRHKSPSWITRCCCCLSPHWEKEVDLLRPQIVAEYITHKNHVHFLRMSRSAIRKKIMFTSQNKHKCFLLTHCSLWFSPQACLHGKGDPSHLHREPNRFESHCQSELAVHIFLWKAPLLWHFGCQVFEGTSSITCWGPPKSMCNVWILTFPRPRGIDLHCKQHHLACWWKVQIHAVDAHSKLLCIGWHKAHSFLGLYFNIMIGHSSKQNKTSYLDQTARFNKDWHMTDYAHALAPPVIVSC